jgi:hypothetical protein
VLYSGVTEANNTEQDEMTINKIKVKFLGKTEMMFQVIKAGEVVQVLCTEQEAQAWIAAH